MKAKKLYKNIQKLEVSEKTKKGLLGVIDQKSDDTLQKVLDKIDATNKIVIGLAVAILAGSVLNFLSRK